MSFSDVRLAIYVAYAVLMIWRIGAGMGEEWWLYVAGFTVLIQVTRGIERGLEEARVRRRVARLAALDPADAETQLSRIWSDSARRELAGLLREEGVVEQDGITERFPFPRSARDAVSTLFWVLVIAAVGCFCLIAVVSPLYARMAWVTWVVGAGLAIGAGWARRQTRRLASVLEVSHFGVTELADDGARKILRWTQPLVLQNRPKKGRLELYSPDRPESPIHLDYRRLGFERLLRSIVEYGGFRPQEPPAEESDR
jgi:hypothetical protein